MKAQRALWSTNKDAGTRGVLEQEPGNSLLSTKVFGTALPRCAWCKRIRDGTGRWRNGLEYRGNHFEGIYTHTICPTCAEKLYPEIFGEKPIGFGL